jgi:hypothetical protein
MKLESSNAETVVTTTAPQDVLDSTCNIQESIFTTQKKGREKANNAFELSTEGLVLGAFRSITTSDLISTRPLLSQGEIETTATCTNYSIYSLV